MTGRWSTWGSSTWESWTLLVRLRVQIPPSPLGGKLSGGAPGKVPSHRGLASAEQIRGDAGDPNHHRSPATKSPPGSPTRSVDPRDVDAAGHPAGLCLSPEDESCPTGKSQASTHAVSAGMYLLPLPKWMVIVRRHTLMPIGESAHGKSPGAVVNEAAPGLRGNRLLGALLRGRDGLLAAQQTLDVVQRRQFALLTVERRRALPVLGGSP